MSFTLSRCKDKERWDCFVKASPQGSVFCRTPFLDALGEDYDLWFVDERGDPLLGIPVIQRDGKPIDQPYPFTLYQGVLLSEKLALLSPHSRSVHVLRTMEFLLTELEARFPRVSMCLHRHFDDLRSLQWFHYHDPHKGQFTIELGYTGLIDIKDGVGFDAYLATIRPTRRYEYRRALREGLTVEVSKDIDTLDRLHHLTFERQSLKREQDECRLLRAITAAALTHGFGELLVCRDKAGQAASVTLFLFDEHGAYYLIGANDPSHRDANSNTFLLLENIRRCQARELKWIDVCGMNSPQRGDFKASFNAIPVPYYVTRWAAPNPYIDVNRASVVDRAIAS